MTNSNSDLWGALPGKANIDVYKNVDRCIQECCLLWVLKPTGWCLQKQGSSVHRKKEI
jgi:hypothetical protein